MKLDATQRRLRMRILELSHEAHVSHLGSCLSVVDIITAIYGLKLPSERFVLSSGHAAVALYAVLEQEGLLPDPSLCRLHIHPDRNPALGIDVSSGSLGQGLPIGVGIALADRSRRVWAVSSDGEMAEGSMWEAIRIAAEQRLGNLRLCVNANGFGAYGAVEAAPLVARLAAFGWHVRKADGHDPVELRRVLAFEDASPHDPCALVALTTSEQFPFLRGLGAHYHVMSDEDYRAARQVLAGDAKPSVADPVPAATEGGPVP